MPQIVSLPPTAPAVPAANPAVATSAPSTTLASAPGTALPSDLMSPNFLAQFKAALKTIANVVVPPQLTQRPATDPNAAPLMSAVSDEQPGVPSAADADKHAVALMPDLLLELGFAVVPPAFPMPTAPKPAAAGAAASPLERIAQPQLPQTAAPLASAPQARLGPVLLQETVVPLQVPVQPAPTAQIGQALTNAPLTQTPPAPLLGQTVPTPQLDQALADLHRGQALPDATLGQALPDLYLSQSLLPIVQTPAPVSHQPIEHLKPSDQSQPPTSTATAQPSLATATDLSATVMLQPTPGPRLETSTAPVPAGAPQIGFPQPASHGGAQSDSAGSDHSRRTPGKVASVTSEATTVQYAPASDAAMAAAAATTAPINAAPLPVQIGPSQVVSQIAQHADVIRLPGNKGLRIQLHPDDLGGVQVTVRYSATGGVELHINAEHAATGALVQAGWTELRDALAGRGISPDRLVMSVTTPAGAGTADASGGGNRSDPNSSGSSQASLSSPDSQSQGQSRQDNAQQRTSQTWSGGLEPFASTDDNPRVASATGTPSRIDYRV